MDSALDLEKVIRPKLARMEDSIILALFERAQFKTNDIIYVPSGIPIPNFEGNFFEYMLYGTEKLHACLGRYVHHEEHAFSSNLPEPITSRKKDYCPIKKININLNQKIKQVYFEAIQDICEHGDDNQYGSSAACDITCLQALSRRVHYGQLVAESKFQQDEEKYSGLIKAKDRQGIIKKLLDKNAEKKILERVKEKGKRYNVDSKFIANFYKNKIIPLTIEVEVEYLLQRLF